MVTPHLEKVPFTHSPNKGRKIARLVPASRKLVSSNNNRFRDKLGLSSLGLNEQWVSVAHPEQQVELQPAIELIKDDHFVSLISAPPVGALFPISSWIRVQCPLGLSSSSWALKYMHIYGMVTRFRLHTQVLFKSTIITHPKVKFIISNILNRS